MESRNKHNPALLVFDIDGTLLETQRVTVPAVQETFAEFSLPQPDETTICSFFGAPVEAYERWLAGHVPADQAAALVAATNRRELECIGNPGRLYPGARQSLDALHDAGHVLALCSNGPEAYVNTFLDAHRVRPLFATVRARDTKYSGKEEMLGEILEVIPHRPVVVIGDREDDITSAHAHGGRAIAAAYGFGSAEELQNADATVTTASEIPKAVAQLIAQRREEGP